MTTEDGQGGLIPERAASSMPVTGAMSWSTRYAASVILRGRRSRGRIAKKLQRTLR